MKKNSNKKIVLDRLEQLCLAQKRSGELSGVTTEALASELNMQRSNVSSLLNELCDEGNVSKIKGKPVLYLIDQGVERSRKQIDFSSFDVLIGSETSLKGSIQKAKAAMLYPPSGLHSLLQGPTGVGKTMFAELMYKFVIENRIYESNAPFVSFNCADYANNPQLLFSYLFGSKKGAYTGSTEDRPGLVEKARNGVLFLDEIHRLPPEGQEMLFNLIDKGTYRPLGGIEDITNVTVLIICATSESEDSVLLSTFKRRIPMLIVLPSLKERTLEERMQLICEFLRVEARRTGREILLSSDVMRNFILYNCPGNIGQLKSDIQLSCANAFLRCITFKNERIELELVDLPDYIRKGIMNYKQYRTQLDLLVPMNTKFSFTSGNVETLKEIGIDLLPEDFYENIENRILELKNRNVDEKDINLIMSMDIENYFKTYIYKLNNDANKNEMARIVDERIINLVEVFLDFAGKKLNRLFPKRIFFSLCLHLESVLNRIRKGDTIVNYMLNETIEKYPDEYAISMYISELVEREFSVKIPIDEIGYISMFISKDYINEYDYSSNPVVLIAMHGAATASSMADVVNKLVGADNVYAYDMPLDKSADEVYEDLTALILQIDRGGGVLLLVDMGSIGMLGEVISNETKIKIKIIEMATTVLGIECARKAMAERNIDVIWNEVVNSNHNFVNYSSNLFRVMEPGQENVILTVCVTGEGSAVKLKHLIEENIPLEEKNIHIIPMSISGKNEIEIQIEKLAKSKNILGIVGTINPEIHGIPFISATETILDKNYSKIRQFINLSAEKIAADEKARQRQRLNEVIDSLANEIKSFDASAAKPFLIGLINALNENFDNSLSFDAAVGLLFHICSAAEKSLNQEPSSRFKYTKQIMKNYSREISVIGKCLEPLEAQLNIKFSEDERCAILYFLEGFQIEELQE